MPQKLHVNNKDTGVVFDYKVAYCTKVREEPLLENNGILSNNILTCEVDSSDNNFHIINLDVVRWLNVYEEKALNGSVPTFEWRKVSFSRNLAGKKDDKGNILPNQPEFKDRKTTLTGKDIMKKLDLKDGDKLYTRKPETVQDAKQFEITFTTNHILENLKALYVTREH
ncbi:hypothetical protein DdX_17192 [Ditylenchus destructor]|uniref:Uncharacterized protein n=1 Tax=Ditylenchus destructor TaxID=166010 RepID=A0AAD4QTK4_9BILA|nr:hypothetical protein DdX_17192 [Ditylenchus destructor]